MQPDISKRLVWSGLLAAFNAVAGMVAIRLAAVAYRRLFDEEPPE